MFTWICPQCGREVPPSQDQCPNCAVQTESLASLPEPTAGASVEPIGEPVVTAPPPSFVPPPAPAARKGLNPVVVVLLVAGGLLGAGYLVLRPSGHSTSEASSTVAVAPGAAQHPLAKHIEVSGVRIGEDAKKNLEVKLMVTNHSAADIAGMQMNVTLLPKNGEANVKPLAEFPLTIGSIGPFESVERTAKVKTSMRAYELPDWQFLDVRFTITAPAP